MDNGQVQPFEIKDFSGGLTDNYFEGGPNRYQRANNFLITVDRKAIERPGTVPFDPVNYILPGQPRRVDSLFTYINESRMMVNQARDIFVIPETYAGWGSGSSGWTAVTGPSGNPALGAGGTYNQTVIGEFNHMQWLTNDFFPIPARLYRDQNNANQARTAGLPRAWSTTAGYTSSTLLSKCITNANAIRTAMISHMLDQAFTVGISPTGLPFQHAYIDKYSLTYLTTGFPAWSSFSDPEFPGPVTTAAPAATDLPSLLTLVYALNNAYVHHTGATSLLQYHFDPTTFGNNVLQQGMNVGLANPQFAPTTLYAAATMLDDIYQKFYWHMMGPNLHGQGFANIISQMNRYDYTSTISKIGTINYSVALAQFTNAPPLVTPNYQDFIDYVNGLAVTYNSHIQGGGAGTTLFNTFAQKQYKWQFFGLSDGFNHSQPDTYNICTLPLATTIDQAYLTIYWLRNLISEHLGDAGGASFTAMTFSSTANSPNITSVVTGSTNIIPVGSWIFVAGGGTFNAPAGFTAVALVKASAAGTATLDRSVTASLVAKACNYTNKFFHGSFLGGLPQTTTVSLSSSESFTSSVSATGTDLISWNAYAQEFMYVLFNHMIDGTVHTGTNSPGNDLASISPTITPGISNWFVPTISTLLYAFTFYDTWTVEPSGVQYAIEGNPVLSASIETVEPFYVGASIPSANTAFYQATTCNVQRNMAITGIPVITNDSSTNYNTSGIQVRIYRTITGGTTQYLDNTINNGVTTFADVQNSTINSVTSTTFTPPGYTSLLLNTPLYTSGGIVGADQPPQCKCLHVKDGTALFGNLLVAGQYLPNQLLQSFPGNPDWAPATFTDSLEDEIVNISSHRSNWVVFCKNSVYREYGGFNQTGQGNLAHERISEKIGCLGARSVVKTEIGVFFAGNDGFYYTDGYQLIKISIDRNIAYAAATQTAAQQQRIYGAYDKTTRRIWWSVQSNPSSSDVDCNWIFYLDYGIKPSGVFTFAYNDGSLVPATTNGASSPSVGNPLNYNYWMPSAVVFYQGNLVRGDPRGLLFRTEPTATTDPKIDLTSAAFTFAAIPTYFTMATAPCNASAGATYLYGATTLTVFAPAVNASIIFMTGPNVTLAANGNMTLVSGTGDAVIVVGSYNPATNSALVPTQNWNTIAIPFDLTTCAMDSGTLIQRKYATKANFTGKNVGNAQVQINSISDNGRIIRNMSPINYTQNPLWGDATIPWGGVVNPNFNWYYGGDADYWRRFPANSLRANLRQLQITNAFMGIYRYQDWPNGALAQPNVGALTVTLATPAATPAYGTLVWPLDCVDYFIAFQTDGYVQTWQISAVNGNVLTVLDPLGVLYTNRSGVAWVIRGYKKNMSVRIDSLGIRQVIVGDNTASWSAKGDSGENAT